MELGKLNVDNIEQDQCIGVEIPPLVKELLAIDRWWEESQVLWVLLLLFFLRVWPW